MAAVRKAVAERVAANAKTEAELGCAPRRYHARMAADARLAATQFHAPRLTTSTGAAVAQLSRQYEVDAAHAKVAAAAVAEEMARAAVEMAKAVKEYEAVKAAEAAKRAEAAAEAAAAEATANLVVGAAEPSFTTTVGTTPRRSARASRAATPVSVAVQAAAAPASAAAKAKAAPVVDVAAETPRQRDRRAATPKASGTKSTPKVAAQQDGATPKPSATPKPLATPRRSARVADTTTSRVLRSRA